MHVSFTVAQELLLLDHTLTTEMIEKSNFQRFKLFKKAEFGQQKHSPIRLCLFSSASFVSSSTTWKRPNTKEQKTEAYESLLL